MQMGLNLALHRVSDMTTLYLTGSLASQHIANPHTPVRNATTDTDGSSYVSPPAAH